MSRCLSAAVTACAIDRYLPDKIFGLGIIILLRWRRGGAVVALYSHALLYRTTHIIIPARILHSLCTYTVSVLLSSIAFALFLGMYTRVIMQQQ